MSVSAVSGSTPAFQPPVAPPTPVKVKDKDGDYDKGAPEGVGDKDKVVDIKA